MGIDHSNPYVLLYCVIYGEHVLVKIIAYNSDKRKEISVI